MKKISKKQLIMGIVAVLVVSFGLVPISIGWMLTHPPKVRVERPAEFKGIQVQAVSFTSRNGGTLQGWFLPADQSQKTIIVAHGYHNNRLQTDVPVAPVAKALNAHGYNILLFDFKGNGESDGSLTSLGYYEKEDLKSAIDYLKGKGKVAEHIGVLGYSMGAATTLLATAEDKRIEIAVVDSPFADLEQYLRANLNVWTHLPNVPFTGIILRVLPEIIDVNPAKVSPWRQMPDIKVPVLLIHGTGDRLIPVENSQELYEAAPANKQLWIVDNAAHIGSYKQNPEEYLKRILAWYQQMN